MHTWNCSSVPENGVIPFKTTLAVILCISIVLLSVPRRKDSPKATKGVHGRIKVQRIPEPQLSLLQQTLHVYSEAEYNATGCPASAKYFLAVAKGVLLERVAWLLLPAMSTQLCAPKDSGKLLAPVRLVP